MRIKNWKRIANTIENIRWISTDSKNISIAVVKCSNVCWKVLFQEGFNKEKTLKVFMYKKNAKKYAIEFLKANGF